MSAYNNIAKELKNYLSSKAFFRTLLPFDAILILIGLIILVLSEFLNIHLGSFLPAAAYYTFLLGLLLSYANYHNMFLYTGFLTYGIMKLVVALIHIVSYNKSVNWHSVISGIIFTSLGYLISKHK